MNKQRTVIYTKRRHALMGERIGMDIVNMIWDRCYTIVDTYTFEDAKLEFLKILATELPFKTKEEYDKLDSEEKANIAFDTALESFKRKNERMAEVAYPHIEYIYQNNEAMREQFIYVPITDGRHLYQIPVSIQKAYESKGKEIIKCFEKAILLHTIDNAWKENLRDLDDLKHSVQNASYEQKDPLLIFKLESVNLFNKMVNKINDKTISILMRGQIPVQDPTQVNTAPDPEKAQKPKQQYRESKVDLNDANQQAAASRDTREQPRREPVRVQKTVGRNDPCPCGSGKKFKNCCGKNI
jgi:preprotein translocase subunit SecA